MELKLTAKNDKGTEALKKLYIDSKTPEAKAEGMYSRVTSEDPYTVYLDVKKWPSVARDSGKFAGIVIGMYSILENYDAGKNDVGVE